ncbi:unnamed protein product [Protopolystoma xenopodis]|uniref:Uncharacterized protein n=1 Tax=Protopolystoma xenopodis TaxID=117903 RepID=A0A448XHQ3_9PLAT|nr:unnamed protein product [Protopolystoma xenopodis]
MGRRGGSGISTSSQCTWSRHCVGVTRKKKLLKSSVECASGNRVPNRNGPTVSAEASIAHSSRITFIEPSATWFRSDCTFSPSSIYILDWFGTLQVFLEDRDLNLELRIKNEERKASCKVTQTRQLAEGEVSLKSGNDAQQIFMISGVASGGNKRTKVVDPAAKYESAESEEETNTSGSDWFVIC